MDILDAIGNTSLVRLCKVVPPGCADGRLGPGDTVVVYTGDPAGLRSPNRETAL
jgi:hypothetical protein